MQNKSLLCPLLLAALTLSGCGVFGSGDPKYPSGYDRAETGGGNNIYGKPESVIGEGGILDRFNSRDSDNAESGLGVNSYLWRASLDTVSFMPLASADPFGGTIITDWYSDPAKPDERTKLNVFILGRELKTEGVKVKAFRQVLKGGTWRDAAVASDTERQLEDAVLTRARQMRVAKEEQ